jgi:hypothetical protein
MYHKKRYERNQITKKLKIKKIMWATQKISENQKTKRKTIKTKLRLKNNLNQADLKYYGKK